MDRAQMISILRGRIEIYRRLLQAAGEDVDVDAYRRQVEEDERDIKELEFQLARRAREPAQA